MYVYIYIFTYISVLLPVTIHKYLRCGVLRSPTEGKRPIGGRKQTNPSLSRVSSPAPVQPYGNRKLPYVYK